jgi:CyaY protein
MDETQYHRMVDSLFGALEMALDNANADLDYDASGSVMTIEGPAGKVILSRQPPLSEVWVAAKSGGFHFRYVDGDWRDTRDGTLLKPKLQGLLEAIAGAPIQL